MTSIEVSLRGFCLLSGVGSIGQATFLLFSAACGAEAAQEPRPVVEVEEVVYRPEPADNGAGPMWCHGSTCLVRVGEDVFASGIETLKDVKPLNNCRWLLFHRDAAGWRQVLADEKGRTREPCPLAVFSDGRVFLSANPTLSTDPNEYGGSARPEIYEFNAKSPQGTPTRTTPVWAGSPPFTEHSYRSFAADGPRGELILFQNVGYTRAEWTFRNAEGEWARQGKLKWPWGAEYDKPKPIRVCYPNVALKDGTVHFCGVSDIIEPYDAWRAYKRELTGREWDYDFRRLFYTWTPDIRSGEFAAWVEIASQDKTCGWISPGDLWVAPDGAAHIVWTERAIDERLRERFFPDAVQSHALKYAVVREGVVEERQTLMLAEEGKSAVVPGRVRFHTTEDGRLFILYYVHGTDATGDRVSENRLQELRFDGTHRPPVRVPLQHPMNAFYTATIRAGSAPSNTLDLLGTRTDGKGISYARVRLVE